MTSRRARPSDKLPRGTCSECGNRGLLNHEPWCEEGHVRLCREVRRLTHALDAANGLLAAFAGERLAARVERAKLRVRKALDPEPVRGRNRREVAP